MKISVVTPAHSIEKTNYFLGRIKKSLDAQTFKDFEWIITYDGKMAENTNSAIKQAKGEIIKILFMDDFLYDENALQHIADSFEGGWLASGCIHTENEHEYFNKHIPSYSSNILQGMNTIGSPSVIAFENNDPLLFDESMTWLLDCDYYHRLHERYGKPTLINDIDICIGLHPEQMTNLLADDMKLAEQIYLDTKYA